MFSVYYHCFYYNCYLLTKMAAFKLHGVAHHWLSAWRECTSATHNWGGGGGKYMKCWFIFKLKSVVIYAAIGCGTQYSRTRMPAFNVSTYKISQSIHYRAQRHICMNCVFEQTNWEREKKGKWMNFVRN